MLEKIIRDFMMIWTTSVAGLHPTASEGIGNCAIPYPVFELSMFRDQARDAEGQRPVVPL